MRIQLETDDGAHIYAQYFGLLELNEAVEAFITGQRDETEFGDQYFRIAPRLETGDPRYAWVNQTLFVAEGRGYPRLRGRVPRLPARLVAATPTQIVVRRRPTARGRTEAVTSSVFRVRVATWNVNSVKQRVHRLLPWLDERSPDVVCLQETKLTDEAFEDLLGDELAARGYEAALHGEATWNGAQLSLDLAVPSQPRVQSRMRRVSRPALLSAGSASPPSTRIREPGPSGATDTRHGSRALSFANADLLRSA